MRRQNRRDRSEGKGKRRIVLLRRLPRRRRTQRRLIGLERDRIVENPEAGAEGGLVIGERIESDPDARIKVPFARIILRHVIDMAEVGCSQEIRDRIQLPVLLDRVGEDRIPEAQVYRQLGTDFPVILNVGGQFPVAVIAVGVRRSSARE